MSLLPPESDTIWLPSVPGAPVCLNVAEVGCGNGARCRLWAARGHRVFGVDHDPARIALARKRAFVSQLEIAFDLASASALPWPDRSMDLCLGPALLGSAGDWRGCLDELARVLKPGAMLYLGAGERMRSFRRLEGMRGFRAA